MLSNENWIIRRDLPSVECWVTFASRSALFTWGDERSKKTRHPERGLIIHACNPVGDDGAIHHNRGQTMSTHRLFPSRLSMLLCGLGVAIVNNAALAAVQPATSSKSVTQVDRYSVVVTGSTAGQRDLLAVTAVTSIPSDIESLGDALRWVLQGSGYRLAANPVLSEEVRIMLELPLPAVHRHFELMPLKTVMELMIGPAFYVVQDSVHRLIAFELCSTTPDHSPTGDAP
jgi:type IV pili sensor histidine kinase/response regulator